jgi:alpha-beta hydrolase superfamily lysophospholipase
MTRKVMQWAWEHPWLSVGLTVLALFVLFNLLAYRHAAAMTHYDPDAPPRKPGTKPPSLSWGQKLRLLFVGLRVGRPRSDAVPADQGLTYEVHVLTGGRETIEAWYVPHPHPLGLVLLFHGYTSCKAFLLPEARAFHELGYACFLVDFPGSGGSGGNTTTIGYYEADDVARAAEYAEKRWPDLPRVLFGQSMGGAAILRALAVLGVEARAAIVECPFDRLLTTAQARFAAVGVPAFPGAQLMVFWGGVQHGFNGFRHNPVEYATRVTCPVLVLHGRCDPRVRVEDVKSIYENVKGEKELHVFEGLGHESYVNRQADEWKEVVGRFLQGRDAVR